MSIEAMKQAVRVMGLIGTDLICGVAHHGKKDQHELGEPCPVQQRFHEAFKNLRAAIEQAEKQEPVAYKWKGELLAYEDKFTEMLDEQQRLRTELKLTEQRLNDVATLCANVEAKAEITQGVLKAVNTAAMKLTADLTCMAVDDDDRLCRDRVMERVVRWRNEWDKAMFEYKPKAAHRASGSGRDSRT
jgi:hypothetical protein